MLILTHHVNKLPKLNITKQDENFHFKHLFCSDVSSESVLSSFSCPFSHLQQWGGRGGSELCSSALWVEAFCLRSPEETSTRKWRCSHFLAPKCYRCSPHSRTSTPEEHRTWLFFFYLMLFIWVSSCQCHLYLRGHAYLVPTVTSISTTSRETVLQSCTTLGHRRAFTIAIHRVACVTVSGFWKSGQLFITIVCQV